MANIVYRGSAVPNAVNSAAAKNAPLTNEEIDKNLYALDIGKLDKNDAATQTISGPVQFSSAVTINGNLTVSGSVTTINSTTLSVDDKNIELGDVATPTNTTADGGGITLLGGTDGNKTFNWLNATSSWTSSENLNLATGKTYKIAGSDVLTATQVLGKAVPTGVIVGTTDTQTLTNKTITGTFTGPLTGNVTGNADTATKLATARTINGQTFDGTGNVSFSTTAVSEGTNLYYTDARARAALSFAAGSGAYNSTSGVITIPTNTNQLTNGAGFATTAYVDTAVAGKDNTDEITEGSTNLYFTNTRARAALSFAAGSGAYNSTSGVITIPTNTNQLTNGAGYVTSSGVTSVTATTPIASSGGTTPDISIPAATASVNGYMTSIYAAKLDGIAAGATANTGTVTSVATGTGLTGGTITTTGTISIDSTVATLTGAQTLTNKTLTLPTIGGTGATFNGSTSGTTVLKAADAAGTTTITMPATTGTMALTSDLPTVNSGALTLNIGTAAATNNTVTVITGTGFNANSASGATYQLGIGPALTALASTMTGAGTGFIRKNGADTYSIDANTYLTGNQSITLTGDVTGTGATSIATTLSNNAVSTAKIADGAVTALKLAAASVTAAKLDDGAVISAKLADSGATAGTYNNVTVTTKGIVTSASNVAYATSAHQTHYIGTTQVQASSTNQAVTGITSITGQTAYDGEGDASTTRKLSIIGGSPLANATSAISGGDVIVQGGNTLFSTTGATQRGGSVWIVGGYVETNSAVTKWGGAVYIEGGGYNATGGTTRYYGGIYIGTGSSLNNSVTREINIGRPSTNAFGPAAIYMLGPVYQDEKITYYRNSAYHLDFAAAATGTALSVLGGIASAGLVTLTNATASTTTATGALVVTGGVGVGGQLNVGGATNKFTASTASTTTATGALVVTGGVGIGGQLNVGGATNKFTASTASTDSTTGALVVTGGVGVGGQLNVGGATNKFTANTASTTTATGALVVTGGVGVGGNLNVRGEIVSGLSPSDGGGLLTLHGSTGSIVVGPSVGSSNAYFRSGFGYSFQNSNGSSNYMTIDTSGNVTATGNVTAYSDARLKTNVQTIENSLDKTLKLRGVSYERDGKKNIGVIAQEIREILPEVVHEADDEQKTLSVSYGNVVGLLIEAIKELNAKVEDLQNQLANK